MRRGRRGKRREEFEICMRMFWLIREVTTSSLFERKPQGTPKKKNFNLPSPVFLSSEYGEIDKKYFFLSWQPTSSGSQASHSFALVL